MSDKNEEEYEEDPFNSSMLKIIIADSLVLSFVFTRCTIAGSSRIYAYACP